MNVNRVGSSPVAKQTARKIRSVSKYAEYEAIGGETVKLFENSEGDRIARIYYPYYNSRQVIKYRPNPKGSTNYQPAEYLSTVAGRKTYRLSYSCEKGEWVNKSGKPVTVPGGVPFWNQIPRPVNQ